MAKRMANSSDFKKKLSAAAQKRQAYRDSLQTDDKARAERIAEMQFHEGLTGLPDDYDDKLVAKAVRGSWGKDDLNRYNELLGGSVGASDDVTKPVADISELVDKIPKKDKKQEKVYIPKPGDGYGSYLAINQDNDVNNIGNTYTLGEGASFDNSVDNTIRIKGWA